MGAQASRLFREASEAYLLNDAVRAAAIPDMDDLLDDLQRQFVAAIFDTPDGIDLPTAVQLAMLARFYERIGDHAVTIGERVTYLVTGTLHKPAAEPPFDAHLPPDWARRHALTARSTPDRPRSGLSLGECDIAAVRSLSAQEPVAVSGGSCCSVAAYRPSAR